MRDPAVHSATACDITGDWPKGLDGTFWRIGPHPTPQSPSMRWGAYPGLLVAVRVRDGQAEFMSSRMGSEQAPSASLLLLDDDLIGCGEGGPAWRIDQRTLDALPLPPTGGRMITVPHGRADAGGRLVVAAFDWPEQVVTAWSWTGSEWEARCTVDVPDRNYVHDALVVGDRLVLGLHPLVRTPRGMAWDDRRTHSTWAVARLDAPNDEASTISVDSAPCFAWHAGWADIAIADAGAATITMRAPVRPTPGLFPHERVIDDSVLPGVREWELDVTSASVRERQLTDEPADFPVPMGERLIVGLAGEFQGAPDYTRCAGVAIVGPGGTQARRHHPPGWFGGEFRPVSTQAGTVLMGLVSGTQSATLLVLDPDDLAGEPVASVEIPVSVPAGLHSAWTPA